MIRAFLIWAAVLLITCTALVAAAFSPFLAWRGPIYIAAGFAGVVGMALMLFQPMLAAGDLPGLSGYRGRRIHRWTGGFLVFSVLAHVAGLWITSPRDVIDALLFVSPTPFSDWGVIAMWALFATAVLTVMRRRLRLRWRFWRIAHVVLAAVIIGGTIVHVLLVDGTMETFSKIALSAALVLVFLKALIGLSFPAKSAPRS